MSQVHSRLRAFALAILSAWNVIPQIQACLLLTISGVLPQTPPPHLGMLEGSTLAGPMASPSPLHDLI